MFKLKLNQKTKTGLLFSISMSLTLALTFILFIFSIQFYTVTLAKQNLILECKEIIETHLSSEDGRLIYMHPNEEDNITTDLERDQLSAVIYNGQLKTIGKFGEKGIDSSDSLKKLKDLAKESFDNNKYFFSYTNNSEEIVLSYPIVQNGAKNGVLQIIDDNSRNKQLLNNLIWISLALFPLGTIATFLIGYFASKRGFKPITNLASKMNEIDVHNLSKHLEEGENITDETYQISQAFNTMIDRLNEGVSAQKKFIANASHELKTPLARILSDLETLEMKKKVKLDSAKEEILSINEKIEALLHLANIYENDYPASTFNVKQEIEGIISKIPTSDLTINVEGRSNIKYKFPLEHFRIVITNIILNSIKHGGNVSEIIVTYDKDSVKIKDNGKGMNQNEVNNLQKRYKKDSSSNGYGLGLAIIKEVCDKYNLNLQIDSKTRKGTAISISGFTQYLTQ